jgi:PiT family inorganic phosphate transporter
VETEYMLTAPGIEPEIDAEVDAPITTEVDVSQILFPQESSEDCMSDAVATAPAPPKGSLLDAKLKKSSPGRIGAAIFALMAVAGVIYIITKITNDLHTVHPTSIFPFFLLGLALVIALGFEFVNGFHDTANAVATVIYTHSLEPHIAVVLSGCFNFLGVLASSGAVAYAIVGLLPVELTLKVSSGAGFAMIFALLVAAIIWNLLTWFCGLPASSSHTMIGSILGVGMMYRFIKGSSGVSAVHWDTAFTVLKSLLISPLVGFGLAALLLLALKKLITDPRLYKAPEGEEPPPFYIRALMILTCTGVSFFHGSNDGQKGMGLIMLILIGTVPTAYALNHTFGPHQVQSFIASSEATVHTLGSYVDESTVVTDPELELKAFIASRRYTPATPRALQEMANDIAHEAAMYKSLPAVPANMQANVRNQMYLESEGLRLLPKYGPAMSADDTAVLGSYRKQLDKSTKFIPTWVKVAVALALGLGTMVGWKRVTVTVGERIGKERLTYAQGAVAGIVTMCTIWGADSFGLPVSTTHVLSSGVAGTMVANKSGLRLATVRNIAMAWVFTLPAAAALSASLYWVFSKLA